MAGPTELPGLVREFVDMSKEYFRQETLEPAKRLGRYAGFSLGGAVAIAIGLLLLSVAMVRGMVRLLPEGPNWAALGYLLSAAVLAGIIGIIIGLAGRGESQKG